MKMVYELQAAEKYTMRSLSSWIQCALLLLEQETTGSLLLRSHATSENDEQENEGRKDTIYTCRLFALAYAFMQLPLWFILGLLTRDDAHSLTRVLEYVCVCE